MKSFYFFNSTQLSPLIGRTAPTSCGSWLLSSVEAEMTRYIIPSLMMVGEVE